MWSCRLSKIKKSIANSVPLAEVLRNNSPDQAMHRRHHLFSLSKSGRWPYLVELLIVSTVLALILVLAEAGSWQQMQPGHLLQYIFFIHWVVLCFIALLDLLQAPLGRLGQRTALVAGFVLLLCIVFCSTLSLNFLNYWGAHLSLAGLNRQILFQHMSLYLSFGALMGAFCLRYLYVREQWLQQQNSELNARIQAMQARIHPHFLFNSLNSVVSLISIDPDKAETMLINLSRLFRASLQELKLVSLQQEIDLCRQYLAIEELRLGERLEVEWKIKTARPLNEVQIPLLTLQPLLENSIFHGVESLLSASTISVLVEILQNQVIIVITNPVQSDKINLRKGHGIAMGNVKERLKAYYGQTVQFQTYTGNGIFTTIVQYPYK